MLISFVVMQTSDSINRHNLSKPVATGEYFVRFLSYIFVTCFWQLSLERCWVCASLWYHSLINSRPRLFDNNALYVMFVAGRWTRRPFWPCRHYWTGSPCILMKGTAGTCLKRSLNCFSS